MSSCCASCKLALPFRRRRLQLARFRLRHVLIAIVLVAVLHTFLTSSLIKSRLQPLPPRIEQMGHKEEVRVLFDASVDKAAEQRPFLVRYKQHESAPNGSANAYPWRALNATCKIDDVRMSQDDKRQLFEWYSSIDDYYNVNNTQLIRFPGQEQYDNVFASFRMDKPPTLILKNDNRKYFHTYGNEVRCYKLGTKQILQKGNSTVQCVCRPPYKGRDCSLPPGYQHSKFGAAHMESSIKIRKVPRRIIVASPFNLEAEVISAKMEELADVVDIFILLESNYTAFGTPRPLRLLSMLRRGFLKKFHRRIAYVFLDHFPKGGREDGWIADNYLRNYISRTGLPKQIVNLRHDDLYINLDADETPNKESMLFLKLHDGYPFPVGFYMQTYNFGFYWKNARRVISIPSVVPVSLLYTLFEGDGIKLRGAKRQLDKVRRNAALAKKLTKEQPQLWFLGDDLHPVGWHCSWCGTPKTIQSKLVSAQNGDFPRWGDFPEKRKLDYILSLTSRGIYFDEKKKYQANCPFSDPLVAGNKYLTDNLHIFGHILLHPSTLLGS